MTAAVALAAWLAVAPGPVPGLAAADRAELEKNLRWMLARERTRDRPAARVGVFADAGVWHLGARSVVNALEEAGVPCVALDRTRLTPAALAPLAAAVFPGGWAPHQRAAAGPLGLAAVRGFVQAGGRCLGICAGAYLLSAEVRYDGGVYPYPVRLFDGAACGPVPGLAAFPTPGAVRVRPTPAGVRRGLVGRMAYYSGGPWFAGGTGVTVLATYPDGSAAAVARPVGRGEVILLGVHPERPTPDAGDEAAGPPAGAGELLRRLLLGGG